MSRKLHVVFFVLGAAVFTYLILRIGVAELWRNAVETGWMIFPVLALYGVVYAAFAAAWHLLMGGERHRPSFTRLYAVSVSGFALNYVTPMVNVGGEPFKAAAVAPWLGGRGAAASVALYTMLHGLSYLLIWLTAVALALVVVPLEAAATVALCVAGAALSALTLFVLARHRRGVFEAGLALLQRVPLAGRLGRRLERHRPLLAAMDRRIREGYHQNPGRFYLALGVEYAGRCVSMLEYYLIFLSLGLREGYVTAFLVGSFSALIVNVLFFLPFELGSREGGLYFVFQWLGLDPSLGVFSAIVVRVREVFWVGVGLALMWLIGSAAAKPAHGRGSRG